RRRGPSCHLPPRARRPDSHGSACSFATPSGDIGRSSPVLKRVVASWPPAGALSSGVKIEDVEGTTATALREQWRAASVESVWLRPGDWYHPAVDALTEALVAGECATPAASRLGEMRGSAGVGIAETLDDVAALYRLIGGEPPLDVVRALCEGWGAAVDAAPVRAGCIDPESGLPTLDYLAVRLGETYGAARRHAFHAFVTHGLVLVDVAVGDLHPWRRAARSAAMGRALSTALPPGHPMASLGGG